MENESIASQNPQPPKHPGGRPSKYNPDFCQQIVKYFDCMPSIEQIVAQKTEKGFIEFPTFEKFASLIDVHIDTLIEWQKEHEEFSESYKKCKLMQKAFLIQMGLNNLYNPAAFCFVAKNCTDMRDRQEIDLSQRMPTEIAIKSTRDIAASQDIK